MPGVSFSTKILFSILQILFKKTNNVYFNKMSCQNGCIIV